MLLACANVANLLLARGVRRQREMAVRTSLGARRGQLVGQLLVETSILAAAGGLFGILLCRVGIQLWTSYTADHFRPFWVTVRLDPQVLWMIAAFVVVSCLAAGLFPAWRQSGDVSAATTTGGHETRRSTADRWLVVAQVAGSVAILATCAVLVRTVERLEAEREHLRRPDVLTARLSIYDGSRESSRDSNHLVWLDVLDRLAAQPDIERIAMTAPLPEDGMGYNGKAQTEGGDSMDIRYGVVSPGAFEIMGVDVLAGRGFEAKDQMESEPVIVVDEELARHLFPDLPLARVPGQRLRAGQDGPEFPKYHLRTIVGVVGGLGAPAVAARSSRGMAQAFLAFDQMNMTSGQILLQMRGTSASTAERIAQAVEAAVPGHPLQDLQPLGHLLERDLTAQASARTAFSILAAIALVLAAVGLYGVLAIGVGRQRRELAVRSALGATPGDLLRRVLGHGLGIVVVGCAAGLVLAFWSTRALRSLLHGAPPWDPLAMTVAVLVLLASGLVASWIPASRAAKTEPASALREE